MQLSVCIREQMTEKLLRLYRVRSTLIVQWRRLYGSPRGRTQIKFDVRSTQKRSLPLPFELHVFFPRQYQTMAEKKGEQYYKFKKQSTSLVGPCQTGHTESLLKEVEVGHPSDVVSFLVW